MSTTVEAICDSLQASGLLSTDEVSALRRRWFRPNRAGVDDTDHFGKWLVVNRYVTELQAQLVFRGQADAVFFNQYKLLERIGTGRMAGVYKAVSPDGKLAAVKVLPPSKAKDPKLLARFQRESRLAMRLNHPNVVRTFEAGQAHGLHYIVMEYIEGATLEEVLQRRGQLTPVEAARILVHALLGLQHLHEQQVVHRDLKPGNLMLAGLRSKKGVTAAAQRVVKITDIGLGRALFDEDEDAPDGTELTKAGTLLGTLAYMAPEQAKDAHSADIRADIYSLGCVLYHCLAGEQPYRGMPFLARHTEFPRPLKQFVPDIPETLPPIVEQMLAPDPFQRYQTPAGAARALRIFLDIEEQAAPPPETVVHANPKELEESEADTEGAQSDQTQETLREPAADQQTALESVWAAVRLNDREMVSLFIGAVGVVLIYGLFFLLTGRSLRESVLVTCGALFGGGAVAAGYWYAHKRKDPTP